MEWIELEKILKQIRGITYEKKDATNEAKEGYTPIIRANNIQDFKFDYSELLYINSNKIKNEQIIKKDDIIIATSSGSKKIVGKAVQASENMNFSFGAFCKLIRITSTKVNSKYVGYYFNSDFYRNTISNLAEGANINNIRNEHINNLVIPVPAMEIQEKIVEVLDGAQALIDKRKEQIQLLDRLIESTFYTMFGDPVKNEKGWEFKTLEDLILGEMQNGLYKPSEFYTDSLEGTPIVRIDTFYNGKITNYNFKRLRCTKQEIEKFLLTNNEIVINRVNSIEYLGKSALIKGLKEKTVFESNMMKFKTKSASINNRYLIEVFNTKYFKNQILSRAKKAVNQASINQGDVKSFVVPLPPLPLQNEFAGKVEAIEKQKKLLEKSLELLEENYKSIMDKAFKGQLFK